MTTRTALRQLKILARIDEIERMKRQELDDYENLLVEGKHSRKTIDEAKSRLEEKKLKKKLKGLGY